MSDDAIGREAAIAEAIYEAWVANKRTVNFYVAQRNQEMATIAARTVISHGIAFDVEKAARVYCSIQQCWWDDEHPEIPWEEVQQSTRESCLRDAEAILRAGLAGEGK